MGVSTPLIKSVLQGPAIQSPQRAGGLRAAFAAMLAIAIVFGFVNAAAGVRLQAYFAGGVAAGPLATWALLTLAALAWLGAWRVVARGSAAGSAFTALALAAWGAVALAMLLLYPDVNACLRPPRP